jgi:hypothetical protein
MPPPIDRLLYVQRVLAIYRLMPGTTGRIRRADRQLAGSLHDRGISIDIVSTALLLAAARRTFRSGESLPPISSLHYFRPLIDEVVAQPTPPDYVIYLYHKLAPFAPNFAAAATAHQLS